MQRGKLFIFLVFIRVFIIGEIISCNEMTLCICYSSCLFLFLHIDLFFLSSVTADPLDAYH